MAAFYCFDNLGWNPEKYDSLPEREKALVRAFALHSMTKKAKEAAQAKEMKLNG